MVLYHLIWFDPIDSIRFSAFSFSFSFPFPFVFVWIWFDLICSIPFLFSVPVEFEFEFEFDVAFYHPFHSSSFRFILHLRASCVVRRAPITQRSSTHPSTHPPLQIRTLRHQTQLQFHNHNVKFHTYIPPPFLSPTSFVLKSKHACKPPLEKINKLIVVKHKTENARK